MKKTIEYDREILKNRRNVLKTMIPEKDGNIYE